MLKLNLISLPKGPIKGIPLYKYLSAGMGYVQRGIEMIPNCIGAGQQADRHSVLTSRCISACQLLRNVNLTHGWHSPEKSACWSLPVPEIWYWNITHLADERYPRTYWDSCNGWWLNPLTPNDPYRGRTAPLTSKRRILYIYPTNLGTEYRGY